MNSKFKHIAVGSLAGGLFGFWVGARKKLSRTKLALVTAGSMVAGGGVGYGVDRIRSRVPRMAGMYPDPKPETVTLSGTGEKKPAKWQRCRMPEIPQKGKFDQWSMLVRTNDPENLPRITCSTDIFEKILKSMGRLPQEEFIAIYLNNANKVIGTTTIGRGGVAGVNVGVVDIYRPAILSGAARIVVAHNHPSGEILPSSADRAVTDRITETGTLLGIPLLDHLIVGDNTYSSMRDLGLIRG